MRETTLTKTKRKPTTDYKAVIAEMFAEIDRLNKQMHQDQIEIDHLKIKTDALKPETHRLKSETRAILIRLGATL